MLVVNAEDNSLVMAENRHFLVPLIPLLYPGIAHRRPSVVPTLRQLLQGSLCLTLRSAWMLLTKKPKRLKVPLEEIQENCTVT
jgi:hypothetical protein